MVFGTMVLVTAVWAHDKHHPELSDWFRSLANSQGTPCCDGSDATRIEDVDWQTICEAGTGECHYQVRLEGKWWHVPPSRRCGIWQSCRSGAGLASILSGP